ncbi:cytochrome P450 4C1-like isoform X3 [Pseudomyrmex gracilis]|uniref:cytochrome P450 4C1-like isoform X3 n=1 Tax=Pseudomyrmex gracilis TaxID=219809 RepID=UPI000994CFB5|nr:cytochrome P450 4C1-like isoform X3 [Pseudomyrmex gracilis]
MSERTEMMIKHIEEKLAENPQQAINIVPYITKVAGDIILETAMGITSYETLSEYSKALNRYLNLYFARVNNWIYLMIDALGPIYDLLPIARETKAVITYMHNFANEIIQKRKLMRNMQDDKIENLQNDYNASGNYLKYQEKIHEELEEVFKDSQKPATVQEISQLKYLDRVIKESRRLYPTIPYIVRKLSDDTKIGDYTIPNNTRVHILILLLHRNPAIWPDPLKFDPDRFLPENIKSMHPYAYIPFSAGPRNCIGQKFATLEEKIILTAILRKWRIKCVETPETIIVKNTITLVPVHGIHIKFIPKK